MKLLRSGIWLMVFLLAACQSVQPAATQGTPITRQTSTSFSTPFPSAIPSGTPSPDTIFVGTAYPTPESVIQTENASNLTLLAGYGNGFIHAISWSPQGNLIAAATSRGLTLFSAPDFKLQHRFLDHHHLKSLAFNDDGSLLAGGGQDGMLTIWDTRSWNILAHFRVSQVAVHIVQFSPYAPWLAFADQRNSIAVWNFENQSQISQMYGHADTPLALAFDADGQTLYSFAPREQVKRWQITEKKAKQDLYIGIDSLKNAALAGSFNPDGSLFAAAQNNTVKILFTRQGTTANLLTGFSERVTQVSFSPDSKRLAVISGANLSMWNLSAVKGEQVFNTPLSLIPQSIQFSSDAAYILLGGASPSMLKLDDLSQTDPAELVFSDGGSLSQTLLDNFDYARLNSQGRIQFTCLKDGLSTQWIIPHQSWNTVRLSSDGSWLISGDMKGVLQRWEPDQTVETPVWTIQPERSPILTLAVSPDKRWLAASNAKRTFWLLNAEQGTILDTTQTGFNVSELLFSSDSRKIIASGSGQFQIFSLQPDHTLTAEDPLSGYAARFDPLDNLIYRRNDGHNDRMVIQGQPTNIPAGRVTFSPNGSLMAVNGLKLWLYTWPEARLVAELTSPAFYASPFFTADNKQLILSAWDGTVYIFGIRTASD